MYAGNMPLFLRGLYICVTCGARLLPSRGTFKKEGFKSYRYEEDNESASEGIWVCDPTFGIPTKLFGHGRW